MNSTVNNANSTVIKALKLIDLVAEGNLSLNELTTASGFSRSTTHRLAASLVKHRFLEYADQKYTLGFRLLELGERKKAELHIARVAKPIAQRFAEQTGETVHLAVLDGVHMILIEKIVGRRQLQVNSYVGQRTRAYRTGVGKALIAARPEEEWEYFLSGTDDEARARLLDELQGVRRSGYALDLEESNTGVCCVAAVIRDPGGRPLAAVSFNGASLYLSREVLEKLAPVIKECAGEVERAIRS